MQINTSGNYSHFLLISSEKLYYIMKDFLLTFF